MDSDLLAAAADDDDARQLYGCEWWMLRFWEKKVDLARFHGPVFRKLLHILARAYIKDNLEDEKQWIQMNLHVCLVMAHENIDTCEETDCQWVHHRDDWENCTLLPEHTPVEELHVETSILPDDTLISSVSDHS